MSEINFYSMLRRRKSRLAAMLLSLLFFGSIGNIARVSAHGGEEHGETHATTAASGSGTITHTARLGALELLLKHSSLTPDTATVARLFVTRYATNEAFAESAPAVEIMAADGALTPAKVEKSDTPGMFKVSVPALAQGSYTVRVGLRYAGETDTATFAGIAVQPPAVADADGSAMSWARTLLIALIFVVVLALFGGLLYFVLRRADGSALTRKTVSA